MVKGTLFEGAELAVDDAGRLALKPGETIVVLSAESTTKDNTWPAACVRDAIKSADSNILFMTPQAFRDATFPWFETPEIGEKIAKLKNMPSIGRAVEQIGIRYVISVGAQTIGLDGCDDGGVFCGGGIYIGKQGVMWCGGGAGGAGCLGFLAWQRTSDVSATLWDFKRGILVAGIAAKISGIGVMPALVLPVPLIAPTETAACGELGNRIARFVTTGELPENAEAGADE